MMENNPFSNQDEEDKSKFSKAELDDDDDEDEKKEKKHTPKRAPGISFEKVKTDEEKEKERVKRLSFTDRLLESIGIKPEKKEDDKDKDEPKAEEKVDIEDATQADKLPVELEEDNSVAIDGEATITEQAKAGEKPLDQKVLEAADWEAEPVTSEEKVEKTEPSTPEAKADFAEVPVATEKDEEVEIAPVEPELLETGLESESRAVPSEDEPHILDAEEAEPETADTTTTHYMAGSGWAGGAGSSPWYNAAAADRARAKALEDAENQGHRAGVRRGLGTGLLFGWMFGRHGKKKQAREFEKKLKSRDQEIHGLKKEQSVAQQHLEAVKRTQEHLQSNIASLQENAPRMPENAPNNKLTAIELAKREVALKALEKSLTEKSHEKLKTEIKKVLTGEPVHVDEGKRVETSAWHRIEVDKKTGAVVKDPELAYGKEFRREQKEVFREDATDTEDAFDQDKSDKRASSTVGGSAYLLGGLAATSFDHTDSTYSSSKQESGLASGPLIEKAIKDYEKKKGVLRFATSPYVWLAAVLVVAVLFLIGILN